MDKKKCPQRLRREESFLGLHFDFHAGEDCTQIGKKVTQRMIGYIIDQVKPDYIQCDCKGHPGLSSYPTKVGYPAPGFRKDQLRIWREVTARRGVALYVHYSGVFDREALRHHPGWARIEESGKRDKNNTSVFGPYVDKLLIPQLKELGDDYAIDGAWIDGECWAAGPDYGKKVLKAFQERTGIKTIPRKPSDPYFFEFMEFCREGFRHYLDHYVTELHNHNPNFQIASNWAYSSQMPEPVGVKVDFISGDYSPLNSINSARLEARCMVHQGKPWDLMAWSFTTRGGEGCFSTKSVPQLQQEAAVVLSLGGGFQAYFTQKRDGSISEWQMRLMKEVAEFCRARQNICHWARPVPQIALLYSGKACYRQNERLFSPGNILIPLRGILQSLLGSQNVVDILMEHHLCGRMDEYPLMVIPEWEYLDEAFRREILAYVKAGGNLLVMGPKAAALFKKELGVKFTGKPQERDNWLEYDGWPCGLKTLFQSVKLKKGTRKFGKIYAENDVKGPSTPAASIAPYGRGKLAAVYVNLGERCCKAVTSTAGKFLNGLVRELFPDPLVEVTGSPFVDVTLNRLDDRLMINLVNTAGPHGDDNVYVYDEIPPLGPLTVTIRSNKRPKRVTLEPQHLSLDYKYSKGKIKFTLPRLEIHAVIVVEQ